jgi:hypothetical protein
VTKGRTLERDILQHMDAVQACQIKPRVLSNVLPGALAGRQSIELKPI